VFDRPRTERDVEIAPDFTDADWKALDLTRETDRLRAIEAFRLRIEERFLKPVRAMMSFSRSGFAMLALDSLLVETLEQCIQGVEETPPRQAQAFFRAFLQRPAFRAAFDDVKAELFRQTIRNGILHMAEVKQSSLVRRDGPVVELTAGGDGLIVNPVLFHCRLEDALSDYLAEVKVPGSPLWATFRQKMECIAGKNPTP
jgi:hypothetical protein